MEKLLRKAFPGDWKMAPLPKSLTDFKKYTRDDLTDDIEDIVFWVKTNHGFESNHYEDTGPGETFGEWFSRKWKEGFPTGGSTPLEEAWPEHVESTVRAIRDTPWGGRNYWKRDYPNRDMFTPFFHERKRDTIEALSSCARFGKEVWRKAGRLLRNS